MATRVSLDTRDEPQQPRRARRGTVPALLVAMLAAGMVIGALGPGTGPPTAPDGPGGAEVTAAPMDLQDEEDNGGHGVSHLLTGGASAGAGGSRQGSGGLPAGFARSPDGAAAAATVYLQALTSAAVYEPGRRQQILAAVGDPSWLGAQRARIDEAFRAEARALGLDAAGRPAADRVMLSTIRPTWGAYRVAAHTPQTAEIVIWYYTERGVVARQGTPPAGAWRTSTVALRWAGGDWKLAALPAHRDGPTPDFASRSAPPIFERARLLGAAWRLYANTET